MILGAVVIALVILVVLPLLFWGGLGFLAFVASHALTDHAEKTHEGSELLATNI